MLNDCSFEFLTQLEACAPGVLRDLRSADLGDPRGRWQGIGAPKVASPRTAQEVSAVISSCNLARVGVVPLGGGTGLVGGQVMVQGAAPLILSLERMRAMRAVYPEENVIVVEGGMVLADVQAAAAQVGRLFPLSLAAEGTAQIGGNLAVNAGGLNVLRYGNARDLCLGIEAILPDGQIFNGLKRLRKDNMGYDLRHLLIGSEGTLGVITAAALRLFPRPYHRTTALLQVPSPAAALRLLALAEGRFAGMVSAFELIHRMSFDFLAEALPQLHIPFPYHPEWAVLLELGLPQIISPEESMATLYALAEEAGLVSDGVIAQSEAQRAMLWSLRENIPAANRLIGAVSSHDISLPISQIPDFIRVMPKKLARLGDWRINCFGHLGDGNLHYNVFPMPGKTRADHAAQRDEIKRSVHDVVHEMGGSISAEHGIGRLKVDDLNHYADPAKLAAMRAIKAALDPNGIMNPRAVLG